MIQAASGRIAFELKLPAIKAESFQTNFQRLLNTGSGFQWRVTLEGVHQAPWEEWRDDVARITSLRAKMVPPNPPYRGKEVQDLLEGAKLSAALRRTGG